jgi:hypothetical protein
MWAKQFTKIMKETQVDRTSKNYLDLNRDLTFAIVMIKLLEPKFRFYKDDDAIKLVIIDGRPPSVYNPKAIDLEYRISNYLFTKKKNAYCECNGLTQLRFFLQYTLPVDIEKYGRFNFGGSSESDARELNEIKDKNMAIFRIIIEKINTEKKFIILIKSIRDIIVNELYKYS